MASSISHEYLFDEENDDDISSDSVTSNAVSETLMLQSSKPDGPVIDQIETNNETEHESDFEDVEEDEQNGDENQGEEEIIQKDTDVNGGAPSVMRYGSFKIAPPERTQREQGTSQHSKNYRIRKIQGAQGELWDKWGVQSIFFVRSPNKSKATLLSKAVGTEAKQFLNQTDVGKNIKRQVDTVSATWPRPKQDNAEEEGKKNKTKNKNRATTEVTERLLTLAAKRAAEKAAMKKNQNKMPFTFTLPKTKKKLATNIRAKKAAENVAVVGLTTDEPEDEMQIIEVSESVYDEILQSIEMESPDSITPVINEAPEELLTKGVSTVKNAPRGAATKTVPAESVLKTVAAQITTAKTGLAKPVSTELIVSKAVATKPVATKPVATKPVATKPVATKPVATKPVATSSAIEIPSSPGLENMSESSVIDEALEKLSTKVVSTGNSASQGAATKTVPAASILKKILPVKSATVKTVSSQITTTKTGLPKPISTELIATKPVATKPVATKLVATSSTIEIPRSRGLENMSETPVIDRAPEEFSTKVVSTGNSTPQGAATKTIPVKSILKKVLPVKPATVKTVSAQITTSQTGLPKPISTELIATKPVATKTVATKPVATKPVTTKTVATSNTIEIPLSPGLENISETSAPLELVANTVVTENVIPGVANISVPDKFLAAAMVEISQGLGSELDTLPETSEIETLDKMDAASENLAAKTVVTEFVAPTNVAINTAPVPFVRFVAAESIASVNVPPKSDEAIEEAITVAAKTDDPKDAVPKILPAKSIEPKTVATRSIATRTKSVNSIASAARTDALKDGVPKILPAKSVEPRTVATRTIATRTKSVSSIASETAGKKNGAVKITKPCKEQEIAKENGHSEVCMAATCLESTTATAVNWVQCDECSKWFHYKCIGVKRVSRKKRFLCPVCKTVV